MISNSHDLKITWVKSQRRCSLAARIKVELDSNLIEFGSLTDKLNSIQAWCESTKCGRRVSYDIFQFRNNKELSFFLIRWS